ncbi:thioredoxin domain-containing protein [Streptomyces sp. TRM 70351]|uniref:DsbA family protein n=1 Tax=Streptomyces sp. TRM 70351 TaxID=3116552 RepID=UPI002E7AD814|nr:thioredoxin domain-containing protein [Streptomyces sp. TRM 70351]MEE1930486.1 thioredoxin domain-containing protein [Streptomyces sp. TRM 70351]
MSDNTSDGKRSAVERLHEQRAKEQAAGRRKRNVKAGAVVVAVLAAVGVVGYAAAGGAREEGDGKVAEPIVVGRGDAPVTLTVYEDFRCPGCAQFEQAFKDTIHELTEDGKIRTEYHLVSIIDGNMGGDGSRRAANAAACARDAGEFTPYHDLLYAHQPPEQEDAFADTGHLISLAGRVDGLDTPAFRSCVEDGTHDAWVKRSNDAFTASEYNATPTVLLDGESVYGDPAHPLTPESLRAKVAEAAGKR